MISQQLIVNICVVLVLLLYGFDLRTHFAFNWILLRDYWLQSTCILSVRILYCMQMGFCFWQFSNEIHIVEILVIYSVLFWVSVHVCGALCKMCVICMRFFLSIKVILEPRKIKKDKKYNEPVIQNPIVLKIHGNFKLWAGLPFLFDIH